jgi:conjugative transposon TraN protein
MKIFVILVFVTCFQVSLSAQNSITVSETKATHIVCPEKVSYLLSGDPEKVITEVVPEHPNLVRVKAVAPFEGESSLTLVTAGRIYSLLVSYGTAGPIEYLLKSFSGEKAGTPADGLVPEYILKELCRQILFKKGGHTPKRKTRKEGIVLRLEDIGINNDLLFFKVSITNTTNTGYKTEGFNWWIDDKRQVKATNAQEYRLQPGFRYYGITTIPAETTLREVFALPRLTIPEKRILRIEMLEKAPGNTGRKLSLEIKNRDILRARKL